MSDEIASTERRSPLHALPPVPRPSRATVRRARAAAAALVLMLVAAQGTAATIGPKLHDALQQAARNEPIPVLVTLAPRAGVLPPGPISVPVTQRRTELAAILRERFADAVRPVDDVLERAGVTDAVPLWAINTIAVEAPREVVEELARTPGVVEVRLDGIISAPVTTLTPPAVEDWNLERIRAPEVWDLGFTGQGVVIASLDTGVDVAHRRLAHRWRGGDNSWFDPSGEHSSPADASGHGTQVTGLMVADGTGDSVTGVAPGALWIAAKIFDDAGEATLSDIHRGLQWLLDPDGDPSTDDAPQVVNGSWGMTELAGQCFDEFAVDIAVLRAAGITVVFAAGNAGPAPASSVSPANNPGVISVGATDEDDAVPPFSSRGPSACSGGFPSLAAPAVGVRTTDSTFGGLFPDAFAYVSGTSFAAPQVAGAAALLLSAFPAATPDQIEGALAAGAVDIGPPGVDDDSGRGRLDVMAALDALAALMTPPGCTDADGDGYFSDPGCPGRFDCDDGNPLVHPDAWDQPGSHADESCDGRGAGRRLRPRLKVG